MVVVGGSLGGRVLLLISSSSFFLGFECSTRHKVRPAVKARNLFDPQSHQRRYLVYNSIYMSRIWMTYKVRSCIRWKKKTSPLVIKRKKM